MARVRALVALLALAVLPAAAAGQAPGVLHIRASLRNAGGASVPVARHALLISDNPATDAPRQIVTAPDGTATVRLPPGNYTVESDTPFVLDGKGYLWTQTLDVPGGRDTVLELTAANAESVGAPARTASEAPLRNDPSIVLAEWRDGVVAVWTPRWRASGFVTGGLVVTNQRVIDGATAVEVQVTAAVKVAARVLVSDRERDVAVLQIDPAAAALARAIPLGCGASDRTPFGEGQRVVALGAPRRGDKDATPGELIRVEPRGSLADFRLAAGSLGGPVFGGDGRIVGLTSAADDGDARSRRDARVVPAGDVCAAVSAAEAAPTAPRPAAAHLPVEPGAPFPVEALEAAATRIRSGPDAAYTLSSSDFDVAFLTPGHVYDALHVAAARAGRTRSEDMQRRSAVLPVDFGEWSDYFADVPPVLVIRVTPRLTESFWTTIARGAAYTQGVAVPPIKHFKAGLSRLRVLCGGAEVPPIHPFVVERRVSDADAITEALYVFEPRALGPHCPSVTLALSSEKEPEKTETRVVDPQVIGRVWDDFAPYRAAVQ